MQSSFTLANTEISIADVYALSGNDSVDLSYGSSSPKMYCPFGFMHSDEGYDRAFRMYGESNTAHCFACSRTWTPVSLYGDLKGLSWSESAEALLEEFGIAKENAEDRWNALVEARDTLTFNTSDLAEALRLYCARICPTWEEAQFDKKIATVFNRCLALLAAIQSQEDIDVWRTRTKEIMASVLPKG